MSNDKPYDSTPDTLEHINKVRNHLHKCISSLAIRAVNHDASKFEEPEKSGYDVCTVKLKNLTYGTPEYEAALKELKPILDHHYATNTHHPEHYSDGVSGMDLIDVVEMLCDWKAATERMKDGGDIGKSIDINAKRFNLDPQLVAILRNTVKSMGWQKKS